MINWFILRRALYFINKLSDVEKRKQDLAKMLGKRMNPDESKDFCTLFLHFSCSLHLRYNQTMHQQRCGLVYRSIISDYSHMDIQFAANSASLEQMLAIYGCRGYGINI